MKLAVVRIRGIRGVRPDAAKAMDTLGLRWMNTCALIEPTPTSLGIINVIKDYVAFGEVSDKSVAALASRAEGKKEAKKAAGMNEKKEQSVFRLGPPKKGYGGTVKKAAPHGALGKREDMDALISRMV